MIGESVSVEYPLVPNPDDYLPAGVAIDGAVYSLAGQSPAARSKGWGYMGWLLWVR
jgi:hypothetical protein